MKIGPPPTEHAVLDADRSHARSVMIDAFSARIVTGRQTCKRCTYQRATDVDRDDVTGALIGVCAECKHAIDIDRHWEKTKQERERMRGR